MNQYDLDKLIELRQQIKRINQAAMRSIFNSEATQVLDDLIQKWENEINFTDSKKSLSVKHHLNINQRKK